MKNGVTRNYSQDNFTFCYYDRDHLGNVRQVREANGGSDGRVIQTLNYYPFGAQLCDGTTDSNVQDHKYNGKEFDGMHGLNTYDYGARQYNPITTRWDRVDPLCEKYYNVTPYHYCHSNPMNRIDPDGKDDYYTRGGVYLGTNQAETDFIYITDAGQYRKLDNYRYAINLSSRVALNDTELDAEVYSKIFTNTLRLGGYNINELADRKIQVNVWQMEGGSKISINYTDNASFDGNSLAITNSDHTNGAQITAFIWPQGSAERDIFSTRANIINCIEDHEFKGHYKSGFQHEKGKKDPTYRMQKNSPKWKKTTTSFKKYINDVIKANGYE